MRRHESQLAVKGSAKFLGAGVRPSASDAAVTLPTRQFGVTLAFIKEHNNGRPLPPVVQQCIQFLSQPDGKLQLEPY